MSALIRRWWSWGSDFDHGLVIGGAVVMLVWLGLVLVGSR
jgi:hypothetical protein